MPPSPNLASPKLPTISVIVPVKNEEHSLKDLITRLAKTLTNNHIGYELIFIDDHSTDHTVQVIKNEAKKYPIAIYTKKGLPGKAFSLREAFSYCQYGTIAMIDADLQYEPEAIPFMLKKLEEGADIVVANRKTQKTSSLRKFISFGFRFFFTQLLHGLKQDVQSGLKVFRREIIERIKLTPSAWSFDLELLIKARQAGYRIASYDIDFLPRRKDKPKIDLLSASWEIGLQALKLKLKPLEPIFLHPNDQKKRGEGFHFNGVEFIHHSLLPLEESAFRTLYLHQKLFILTLITILVLAFSLNWIMTLIVLIALITTVYFLDLFFNLFLIIKSFTQNPEIRINNADTEKLKNDKLPLYTILCPLYREWEVLPQFVVALSRLDYPKEKLQVLLLLEEDDKETIKHVKAALLPSYIQPVVVPHSLPKTKPKALNYGLKLAKGEYIVVYDAEDAPDPSQLKKVISAFQKVGSRTVCIQAKLNFYNPHQNLLTRIFTAEYSLWFDLILTGLQSIFAPIPLGGTSNHFRTADIIKLKGWDSFNVTEDCDLGMRLAKHGFKTAIINSVTLEEANSHLPNWFDQRTRWIKGYMQTYLVHMRKPRTFAQEASYRDLLTFQLVVGGKILALFINPLMWVTTIVYFAFRPIAGPFIQQFFPAQVLYMGVFSLVFGNFLYMYYYMIGCAKRSQWELIKYVYLVPFYWLAMSIAAWQAVIQLIQRPHYWPKTIHGFHLDREKALLQSTNYTEEQLTYQTILSRLKAASQTTQSVFLYRFTNKCKIFISKFTRKIHYPNNSREVIEERLYFTLRVFKDFLDAFKFKSKVIDDKKYRKKILIFNWRDTKHVYAGGAEVYIQELAKRWVKSGYEVTVFCGNDGMSPRYEFIDGVEIVRRGGFYFVYIWAFLYYMLKFRGKYNVIIDCENGIPFFTPLYAREKIYLLIHHVHQEVFLKSLTAPFSWFAAWLELKLMPFVYQKTQTITVSPSSKMEIMNHNLTRKEPYVIYSGIDLQKYIPAKKSSRPLVLYIGRLKGYKSIHIFIKSAYKVLQSISSARFIIAGDGEEKENLIRMTKKMGIIDKISFLGRVSEEQKIRLYQKAWVFVNTSYMEGWGITSIEANACGTPVVASNVNGLRDSVHNPHSGVLAPYGDVEAFSKHILRLLKDTRTRHQMSIDAIEWASNFDWEKSANESLEVLFK